MFNWFKKLFLKEVKPTKPIPPRTYEVGKALVSIHPDDGEVIVLEMRGYTIKDSFAELYSSNKKHQKLVISAASNFRSWQEDAGKTGMINLCEGSFLPLCKVKKIEVKFEKYSVDGKDNEIRSDVPSSSHLA